MPVEVGERCGKRSLRRSDDKGADVAYDSDIARASEAFHREIALESLDEESLRLAALHLLVIAKERLYHALDKDWNPLASSKVVWRYYLKRRTDETGLQWFWLCLAVGILPEPAEIDALMQGE